MMRIERGLPFGSGDPFFITCISLTSLHCDRCSYVHSFKHNQSEKMMLPQKSPMFSPLFFSQSHVAFFPSSVLFPQPHDSALRCTVGTQQLNWCGTMNGCLTATGSYWNDDLRGPCKPVILHTLSYYSARFPTKCHRT